MFVDTFIKRPILATVCSLVIILAGALAIPDDADRAVPGRGAAHRAGPAIYTGANAETVETAVTTPLEQAINGVEGMLYMTSSSTNSGFASDHRHVRRHAQSDLAAVDVQNRVNQALGRLPAEVRQLGVTVQKTATNFVLAAGAYSQQGEYDSLFLSNYLDVYVKDALKRVPGVADVIIFGERKYSMRLWLDPVRLAARQLTAGDVVNALREQNVNVAGRQRRRFARAGRADVSAQRPRRRPPAPTGRVRERHRQGRHRRHARAAERRGPVELGAETYASVLRFQGRDAVGFGVIALPTANALDVNNGVIAELTRLSKSFPPGLQYSIAFNTTTVVQESIREVLKTLAEAIGLVVLVMFLFLQSWRATIIPALTMPVSLIGAFAFVQLLGFSINTLTLFAIVLATGIVVDDAIVVIENIERHVQEFKKRRAAGGVRRDARGVRRGHRDGAGADRGVRAGGVLSRARPAGCISSSR